jgi:hypothetical protein
MNTVTAGVYLQDQPSVAAVSTLQVRICSWLLVPLCLSPTMLWNYPKAASILLNAFIGSTGSHPASPLLCAIHLRGGGLITEGDQDGIGLCDEAISIARRNVVLTALDNRSMDTGRVNASEVRYLLDTLGRALLATENRRDVEGRFLNLAIQVLLPQLG